MEFQLESMTPGLIEEIVPIIFEHHHESGHFKELTPDPDFDAYQKLSDQGMLRVFTVRDETKLVGYSIFIVLSNIHFKTQLQAHQDTLYIRQDFRGNGIKFIQWCDRQLQEQGVKAVSHHVCFDSELGTALERIGYVLSDHIYFKRFE